MAIKTFRDDFAGKKIDRIEISTTPRDSWVAVYFEDQTVFLADLEPTITVRPERADYSGGNVKRLEQWEPLKVTSF